mgnify:CR=1 FL=1
MNNNKNNIGVIGAGTMGNGIAHVFSLSEESKNIFLIDIDKNILNNAIINIKANLSRQRKKEFINQEQMNLALSKIHCSTKIEEFKNCDIVIEAVKEDLSIKKSIFSKIGQICNQNTIFASNTSSISITEISKALKYPENMIGMHFMNPVPIMKLVEIIKGKQTSDNILIRTLDYVKSINKIAVECNDSPGFVSNRILMPMINEAAYALMEGVAEPESIDKIMKLGMGHPMGPLKLADLIGIDVCVYIMGVLYEGFKNEKYKPCPMLLEMVNNNELGVKSKKGFYIY